ncbi:MAG TPA: anti-sigma factor [Flavobacteriaceae bacterium]|nr:anti-sigma factor [Flavobacteriaceae bacterium]HPF12409.1 anti-sigma factor [Flavobacteriaceae bacterium]HQU21593.1 anti-sigma factor [Flavobacteriaceae bacterium]HQU66156.1 anti-sigma factor [Flavobacteriaceae bacterium]HRW45756.1 anti-sigma factor [Flavobacteriaceae bacterium]
MEMEEIITSGQLELYVTGSLSQREAMKVEELLQQYPEVKKEVEAIEKSLIGITENKNISIPPAVWENILARIKGVRTLPPPPKGSSWSSYVGWAAAVVFLGGIFWMLFQNNKLSDQVQLTTIENIQLEEKVSDTENSLAQSEALLDILRSKDYKTITLPGNQAVAPQSYAKVYYSAKEKIAYVDARGLPEPPNGKVYQVWSLIMDPLTPRSVGLLEGYETSSTKVFKLENIPDPEAFGITLEPKGGSESPTLTQLYTLGMVSP